MSAYQRIAKIADPNVDPVKLENIVQRVMASDLRQPACRRGVARAPGPQAESTRSIGMTQKRGSEDGGIDPVELPWRCRML
jgi:hypothetical protein